MEEMAVPFIGGGGVRNVSQMHCDGIRILLI